MGTYDDYEEKDCYQITEAYVTLYKDGKEIAYGRMGYTLYECTWNDEDEEHDRQIDGQIVIWWGVDGYENGKEIEEDEIDYEEIEWGEEREVWYGPWNKDGDYEKAIEHLKKFATS